MVGWGTKFLTDDNMGAHARIQHLYRHMHTISKNQICMLCFYIKILYRCLNAI